MSETKEEGKEGFFSKLRCNKEAVKRVSYKQMFRFAEKLDCLLIFIGMMASLGTGACLPSMVVVFGGMTSDFIDFSYTQVSNDTAAIETGKDAFWEIMKLNTYYFILIGAIVLVTGYIQVICWLTVSYRQCFKIRNNLFQCILHQEIGWFDTNDVGQLATRLTGDVNKIQEGIGDKMSSFFQWMSTFLTGLIIGFVHGPKLAAVVIAISPLVAISGGIMTYMMTTATSKELTAYAKAGSVAEEVFAAMRTVVAFSGQEKAVQTYTKNLDKAKSYGIKKGIMSGSGMGVALMIIFCSYALAFWYGGKLIRENEMDIGNVLTVFFAVVIGAFALGNSGPSLQAIGTARGAAFTLWNIMDRKSLIDSSSTDGIKLDSFAARIDFEDVSFKYPSRKELQILKGLKMKLDEGLTVAVVGESGCGKSTVIQLVERFYDTEGGCVMIDGTDIKKINVKWLRQQIGVVNQEPVLFATTIATNIAYGLEGATQAHIQEAAKKANAHEFIMNLPQKYETMVGERGAHMSGGQKQRIAIARALMKNPRILLLDEATSALDNESESIVQAALDKARAGRTTIIVAHRLSTIRNADIIFGIKDGVVYEYGSHDELMEKKGIYYTLVTNQQVGDQDEKQEPENVEDTFDEYEEVAFKKNGSLRRSKRSQRDSISKSGNKKDEKEVTKDVSMMRLMAYNKPEWLYIVVGSIAALIHGAIQPAFAVLFAKFIGNFGSNVSQSEWESNVALISGMFAVIGLVAFLSLLLMSVMFAISGETLTKRMRVLLFKHILRQNMEFFDDHNNSVGALVTRLSTDASAIQGGTGVRLGMLFQAISSIGVGIIIGFIYSWKLTLLILCCLPLLVLGAMLEMKMAKGFSGKNDADLEEAGKVATEAISNIRTVALLCKEEMFGKLYHDKLHGPYKKNLCHAHLSALSYSISQSLIFFAYAAIFILGAHLNRINDLDYEDMFLVFGAVIFGAMAMGQASQFGPDYAKVKVSLVRIFDLLDSQPSIDIYSTEGIKPEKIEGMVNFVDVSFAYPTRKSAMVLNKFNLKVDPGLSVALVGFSGSGKSTTIQLLERFYDCLDGSIMLDKYNIKSVNVMWLRSQMGLVQQEPMLFDCSIRENIAYGDNSREVSMEEITEAARKANIADFIGTLPEGYETNVGDKGVQMSGGQKQRLAIARALVRNPKILLLDEATSALDTESEKVVQEALQKAQVGRTSLVIAHRLSTIQNSDCIFVFNKGVIAEYGTHNELLKQKGIYYNLRQTQH